MIDLGNGKQVVVSSDLGQIRLKIWANGGCLGVDLDKKSAVLLRNALYFAIVQK